MRAVGARAWESRRCGPAFRFAFRLLVGGRGVRDLDRYRSRVVDRGVEPLPGFLPGPANW